MIEKHIVLEDIDPVIFYGVNNANMQMIKALYPKLRIVARGNVIKVMGDEEEMCAFEESIVALEKHCVKYNSLKEEVILDIVKGKTPQIEKTGDTIVFSVTGKPIVPRSENQLKLVKEYEKNDMLFAIGPAGSGKTYTAIALAVRSLKNKEIKKIILSRPAVEAGEKLGFLPGDMKDKIDPYLQPLYDALQDMIPAAKLKEYMEMNVIQIAPLAFMRGRTLNDAVVIHFPEGGFGMKASGEKCFEPSFRVAASEIVSSVGAGDAFCAAMLYALHEELPLSRALQIANAAARFNLYNATATDGAPTLKEIEEFLNEKGIK